MIVYNSHTLLLLLFISPFVRTRTIPFLVAAPNSQFRCLRSAPRPVNDILKLLER
jgi:hypothetical protein